MSKRIITALLVGVLAMALGGAWPSSAQAQDEGPPAIGATASDDTAPAASDEADALVPPDDGRRTFAELFGYGGWVMWVLVVLSAIVLALILERMISLRSSAVIPGKFMRQLMEHWRRRDIGRVIELCAHSQVSIARVLRAGLLRFDEGLARMEDAVDVAGQHEATILRRNLGLIAALGNIATMVGLLGTVLGMIDAFDVIAKTGTGDASVVAGGIFQALITTAAGLMVGITALGAHSFLRRRVEVLEINLEETSFRMLEELQRPMADTVRESPARDSGSLAPAGA